MGHPSPPHRHLQASPVLDATVDPVSGPVYDYTGLTHVPFVEPTALCRPMPASLTTTLRVDARPSLIPCLPPQNAPISAGAARYLHLAIPALYFTGLFEAFKRYLMAQVKRDKNLYTRIAVCLAFSFFFFVGGDSLCGFRFPRV